MSETESETESDTESEPDPEAPKNNDMKVVLGVLASLLVMVLIAVTNNQTGQDDTNATPEPSPTYSGTTPKWYAYEAGRNFGQASRDTARIPADKAKNANTLGEELYEAANGQANDQNKDLGDAVAADMSNASWWCQNNLPTYLESAHEAQYDALVKGCIGGVLPMFDAPYMYGDRVTGKATP
ncbi:hypothetical protein ACWCYZ_39555 [Streptomyces virginiae]